MTPKLPFINIYGDSYLDIITGEYPLDETTLYGLFKEKSDKRIYYDHQGLKWECDASSSKYKLTFLNRVLANTINPKIKIARVWRSIGSYDLSELKNKIKYCIDKDDDILTQFIDANELKLRIDACEEFHAIVEILFRLVFKPEKYKLEAKIE